MKYEGGRVTLWVIGPCKSAGTLVAIGAHEIAFAPHGELGPLHAPREVTRYFTARVSAPQDKARRQSIYIDAIAASGVDVIEGKYQDSQIDCKRCGRA